MRTLMLWDVDHTLIENGGVSKMNYALAFEILTGSHLKHPARTGGRTDVTIMSGILGDNGVDPSDYSTEVRLDALAQAGERNRKLLTERGHALPGALEALRYFDTDETVISSTLTGNIESNAVIKLAAFGLDQYIDFSTGAFGSESAVRSDLVPVAQRKATEQYGFDRRTETTILIGDTRRDVDAGLDGGARVIAVATGGETVAELKEAGAHVALESLVPLDDLLAALDAVRKLGPVN